MNTLRAWAHRIKRDGLTLWFARSHPATPWHAKALGALVVAYALSPIDLIPDFIPVLGYLDDVILLPLLIWLTVRLLPPQVLADSRHQAEQWMAAQHRKPRSWVGGAVVVLIWVAAAVLIGWWALGQLRTAA
ncbi:MAG: YkvA family protein [Burkholderiaceae bacterium]